MDRQLSIDAALELIAAIGLAHGRLVDGANVLHSERGLTTALRGVLLCVDAHGPQSISRLADLCSVSRQFLQRTVRSLMAGGWVEPRVNPRHKGSPLIALTAEGLDEVARVRASEAPRLIRLADAIGPSDLVIATRVLALVAQNAK